MSAARVTLQAILDRLQPDRDLDYLTVESTDGGFAASVPLEALRQAVIAYRLGDQPLPRDKGGPLRFLIPNDEGCATGGADACANVKFVGTLRLTKGRGKDTRPETPRQHAGLHEREGQRGTSVASFEYGALRLSPCPFEPLARCSSLRTNGGFAKPVLSFVEGRRTNGGWALRAERCMNSPTVGSEGFFNRSS